MSQQMILDPPVGATTQQLSPATTPSSISSPPDTSEAASERPKQKRNKPTLSCKECVERKTKCDRTRPKCLACIKRASECEYTAIANIIATTNEAKSPKAKKFARPSSSDSTSKFKISSITNPDTGRDQPPLFRRRYSDLASEQNQINVKLGSSSAPISIFGTGQEHPFANYWTCQGGLAEVVRVAPSKEQADILVAKYFSIVDPLYPVIDRTDFLRGYNEFWTLSPHEQAKWDGPTLALHFAIYANATLFVNLSNASERARLAEFYISASHQALRLSSYWNHVTLEALQAMLLTFYFLISDNHVSDAWTCAGFIVRQAQVLQLNRDPSKIKPHATAREKQIRLQLWMCIMTQNVVLGLFLRLSPSMGHTDIKIEAYDQLDLNDGSHVDELEQPDSPIPLLSMEQRELDLLYTKCMVKLLQYTEENLCKPRALDEPTSTTPEHRKQLLHDFRSLYTSMSHPYGSYDPKRFLVRDSRLARQQIGFCSNFFHPMTILHSESNSQYGIYPDVRGALKAAHECLLAFFAFVDIFPQDINGFWAYQHRSFEVALTMANLLADKSNLPLLANANKDSTPVDWLVLTAKEDVAKMLSIISKSSGYFEFQTMPESRLQTLQAAFNRIEVE